MSLKSIINSLAGQLQANGYNPTDYINGVGNQYTAGNTSFGGPSHAMDAAVQAAQQMQNSSYSAAVFGAGGGGKGVSPPPFIKPTLDGDMYQVTMRKDHDTGKYMLTVAYTPQGSGYSETKHAASIECDDIDDAINKIKLESVKLKLKG